MSYATPEDLAHYALTPPALANFSEAQQLAALEGASAVADGYLRTRYGLPLRIWSADLRRTVCLLAAYDLMTAMGYNPEGDDANLRLRSEDALRWLRQVSEGRVVLEVGETKPSSPLPRIHTAMPRGW